MFYGDFEPFTREKQQTEKQPSRIIIENMREVSALIPLVHCIVCCVLATLGLFRIKVRRHAHIT